MTLQGHNHPRRRPSQWQTPHEPHREPDHTHASPAEADFDLVEAAFIEGFGRAGDPTSFLRLAGVPFEGREASDGASLCLLRVEIEEATDVGTVTPRLGGGSFRYDPLPAALTGRRTHLHFVYHDGARTRRLSLAEAKALLSVEGRP